MNVTPAPINKNPLIPIITAEGSGYNKYYKTDNKTSDVLTPADVVPNVQCDYYGTNSTTKDPLCSFRPDKERIPFVHPLCNVTGMGHGQSLEDPAPVRQWICEWNKKPLPKIEPTKTEPPNLESPKQSPEFLRIIDDITTNLTNQIYNVGLTKSELDSNKQDVKIMMDHIGRLIAAKLAELDTLRKTCTGNASQDLKRCRDDLTKLQIDHADLKKRYDDLMKRYNTIDTSGGNLANVITDLQDILQLKCKLDESIYNLRQEVDLSDISKLVENQKMRVNKRINDINAVQPKDCPPVTINKLKDFPAFPAETYPMKVVPAYCKGSVGRPFDGPSGFSGGPSSGKPSGGPSQSSGFGAFGGPQGPSGGPSSSKPSSGPSGAGFGGPQGPSGGPSSGKPGLTRFTTSVTPQTRPLFFTSEGPAAKPQAGVVLPDITEEPVKPLANVNPLVTEPTEEQKPFFVVKPRYSTTTKITPRKRPLQPLFYEPLTQQIPIEAESKTQASTEPIPTEPSAEQKLLDVKKTLEPAQQSPRLEVVDVPSQFLITKEGRKIESTPIDFVPTVPTVSAATPATLEQPENKSLLSAAKNVADATATMLESLESKATEIGSKMSDASIGFSDQVCSDVQSCVSKTTAFINMVRIHPDQITPEQVQTLVNETTALLNDPQFGPDTSLQQNTLDNARIVVKAIDELSRNIADQQQKDAFAQQAKNLEQVITAHSQPIESQPIESQPTTTAKVVEEVPITSIAPPTPEVPSQNLFFNSPSSPLNRNIIPRRSLASERPRFSVQRGLNV